MCRSTDRGQTAGKELVPMAPRRKNELELAPEAYDDPDPRGAEPVEGSYPKGKRQDEVPS
jgi:hypothetical protein